MGEQYASVLDWEWRMKVMLVNLYDYSGLISMYYMEINFQKCQKDLGAPISFDSQTLLL